MITHVLRVGFRYLFRQKTITFINVLGLAVGLSVSFLISSYLRHEWTFDRYFPDNDRVYRVIERLNPEEGEPITRTVTTSLLRPKLESDIPGVENAIRATSWPVILIDGVERSEVTGGFVDPEFFAFSGRKMMTGEPGTALAEVSTAVITQSFAERIFGDDDPMGQTMTFEFSNVPGEYIITGVVEDPPTNASFEYDVLFPYEQPYSYLRSQFGDHWRMAFAETWVRLKEGVDPAEIETKIFDMLVSIGQEKSTMAGERHYLLQPMSSVHMAWDNPRALPTASPPEGSITLALIALAILAISAINFVTLSLGRSSGRAREVGVRKVLGAGKRQLVGQFWIETAMLTLIAMVLGLLLTELLLPALQSLTESQVQLHYDPLTIAILFALFLVVVLASGWYPAIVMSRFRPRVALTGNTVVQSRSRLRSVLVLIQFTLSIALVSLTMLMASQIRYMMTRSLGFNEEQVVALDAPSNGNVGTEAIEVMKQALADNPDILNVSGAACRFDYQWIALNWLDGADEYKEIYVNVVDPDYFETLQLELVKGHEFDPARVGDLQRGLVVNEAMVERMGWEEPLGKALPGSGWPDQEVIGVVKDFHYSTMHEEIRPLILAANPQAILSRQGGLDVALNQWYTPQFVYLRLRPGVDIKSVMKDVEEAWTERLPELAFDYRFLDDSLQQRYESDERWNSIVRASALLAVAIAVLGLVGLTTLEVARRTREIGIRKVIGASEGSLVMLLTKPMTVLVFAANLLAWPIAWWAMNRWLDNFAYKTEIGLVPLLTAGGLTLAVAWGVTALLGWRAAQADPATVLRQE